MLHNTFLAFANPPANTRANPGTNGRFQLGLRRPRWAICAEATTAKRASRLGANSAPQSVVKANGIPTPPATPQSSSSPSSSQTTNEVSAPAAPKVYEANGRVYEKLPWSTATALAAEIVNAARGTNYDCVLAITRGGLAPAALVAEGLGIRNVLAATVMFYTDEGDVFFGLRVPRFLSFPNSPLLEGRRVLVVDDVWDSGRTASAVRDRAARAGAEEVGVAVLHYKKEGQQGSGQQPDYYGATTNRWILYPWEVLAIEQIGKE